MAYLHELAVEVWEMLKTKIPAIETKVNEIDAEIGTDNSENIAAIKTETDKIPAEVVKTTAIKVETDKIPATITKIDSLESKTAMPTKNMATNTTIALAIGSKEDDEDGNSLHSKTYIQNKHIHSRSNTYPYLANAIQLTGGAGAWTPGNKVEVVPVATNDIQTLTITHAADSGGSIDIFIDDKRYPLIVMAGTINEVAEQIRNSAASFEGYTVTGADADIIFTRLGKRATGRFVDTGTTGVTATMVHTNVGVGIGQMFDLHFITPSAPSATTTYQIDLWAGLAGYEERIATKRVVKANAQTTTEPLQIMTPLQPAGTRISASVATLAGGGDTISVSTEYHNY